MSKIAFRSIDPNDRHADLVRIVEDPATAILQRVGRRLSTLAFSQGILPMSHANLKWRALGHGDDMPGGLRLAHSRVFNNPKWSASTSDHHGLLASLERAVDHNWHLSKEQAWKTLLFGQNNPLVLFVLSSRSLTTLECSIVTVWLRPLPRCVPHSGHVS